MQMREDTCFMMLVRTLQICDGLRSGVCQHSLVANKLNWNIFPISQCQRDVHFLYDTL